MRGGIVQLDFLYRVSSEMTTGCDLLQIKSSVSFK